MRTGLLILIWIIPAVSALAFMFWMGRIYQRRSGTDRLRNQRRNLNMYAKLIFDDLLTISNLDTDDIITDNTRKRITEWLHRERMLSRLETK